MTNTQDWIELARTRISGAWMEDLGAWLGLANLPFGLAKILSVQDSLGLAPDAAFHATPDFAVTRNRTRWSQGFAYGGLLTWSGDFTILDLKPNACGMLVGGLRTLPDSKSILQRLATPGALDLTVEGTPVVWDFETSNHFFQIYSAEYLEDVSEFDYPYLFVIHGSGEEWRSHLYYDRPDFVRAASIHTAQTPVGTLHLLTGNAHDAYNSRYAEIEAFAMARRAAFAKAVLPDGEVLLNVTHQGLFGPGRMALGCVDGSGGSLYPFAQREELPFFLLRSKRGAQPSLLPHGSGYRMTMPAVAVEARGEQDSQRQVVIRHEDGQTTPVADIRALEFTYRGSETLDRTVELGLATPAVRLSPVCRIYASAVRDISGR